MRRRGPLVLLLILLIGLVAAGVIFLLLRNNQTTTTPDAGVVATTLPGGATAVTPGAGLPTTAAGPTPTPVTANVKVVVVTRNLSAGTQLLPDDLDLIDKSRAEYDPDNDLTSKEQAYGRIIKNPILARQQLKSGDLVDGNFSTYMKQLVSEKRLEPGKKAFAYATNDLSAAAGLIAEGDLVDVIATYVFERKGDENNAVAGSNAAAAAGSTPASGSSSTTRPVVLEISTKTVLQNVRVLKVIRFGPPLEPFRGDAIRSTATPGIGLDQGPAPQPTSIAVGPGTPTPMPTVPPYEESGRQFGTTMILVLAVTDQEAEVLKFTREARVALSASVFAGVSGARPDVQTQVSADRNILATIPVIHFTLRSRPQDPTNPQDPSITIDKTSGVTYRTLVRDYGLPIPEAVFATNLNQR
ncbi:MAG: Flp pilus assembly protein CpaB [Chloroflexi bacterium]|uniref:Flp pilus assembly protein CpaB n=1 Tax=Candidatus Chlorohelix allophototropha TaxID=3003348 RepID=A0A8T7M7F6_9CHLR|nr:Flp pilus assembly protein CpaB [Chloroflexota bacterium]WJW68021.1 Flp pilus assembly protein CpaB [Chloroflexota bacterium L227-S17]